MKFYLSLIFLIVFCLFFNSNILSQNLFLKGRVEAKDNDGKIVPLINANVYWLGRTTGTTTDINGNFQIQKPKAESMFIIVSYVGYLTDTILVKKNQLELNILLRENKTLKEITISENREGSYISKLNPIQTQVITTTGMQKLACCNLSESFENNASVDVAYTDAISGSKQIQLLGLAGVYGQILTENNPTINGLAVAHGLGYVPGPWMESIQISKGASPVINGFESTTGQINVEYKKPENSEKLHVNIYGNTHEKIEGNITSAKKFNDALSTMIMAHAERFENTIDDNKDGFQDIPKVAQLNLFNRWRYELKNKFVAQAGVKILVEKRKGGQTGFKKNILPLLLYGTETETKRYEAFFKTGIPINNNPENNIAIVLNASLHEQNSFFGKNNYDGQQKSFFSNVMYQHTFTGTGHKLNTGLSYKYDKFGESLKTSFVDTVFPRTNTIPGIFSQYTYNYEDKFIVIAGARFDYKSKNEQFYTPRLHVKYDINKNSIIKISGGKGYRIANVLSENTGLMATSKKIIFSEDLKTEEAWNYGISFTQYFKIKDKKTTFTLDFYRTDFINQVVVDMDKNIDEIWFYNLREKSFSNSMQAEIISEPIKRLEINMAFRINDVKTTTNGILDKKPFVNKYKGLVTLSYATEFEKWKFDATFQYNGNSRLLSTDSLPSQYRREKFSPDYVILFLQITKNFKNWNVYAGVENLTGFVQKDPIIGYDDPFGIYFDASQIWGPLAGRGFYAGLRLNIK